MLLLQLVIESAFLLHSLAQERHIGAVRVRNSGERPELSLSEQHKFHLFLSHVWSSGQVRDTRRAGGCTPPLPRSLAAPNPRSLYPPACPGLPSQDAAATIKRQLQLLLPGVQIFLDVDNLQNISDLEENVQHSAVILLFMSTGCIPGGTRIG
eukprot:4137199-Prymnesium_polylepis.1